MGNFHRITTAATAVLESTDVPRVASHPEKCTGPRVWLVVFRLWIRSHWKVLSGSTQG